MNDMPPADTLPTDALLWEALPDLTLNIAQTAALCSISIRQLGYWTRQGYVEASGQGARRAYGLAAIRKVLAIRKAMEAGASLRQSLRQVSDSATPRVLPEPIAALAVPLLPPQAPAVSRSLAAFFAANTHTRDHVGGLAVKLGWAEDDVRRAAEALCASGLLARSVCQGMTVFYPCPKDHAHA